MYCPPGQLDNFLEELDMLLSSFPEDGSLLVLLGNFNIHPDKSFAADFHSLLASFKLQRLPAALEQLECKLWQNLHC